MVEKADLATRFTEKVDRFVAWLEKDRLSIIAIFAYVVIVAAIRDLLEYFLLDQPFVTTPHPWIFSIAHHVSFYVVVFLGLIFLLSAFSGRGVRRVTNFVVMFWWIIILPPVIDHYIGGLNTNYAYFSITDFVNAFFHFSGETFHIGQATEVIVILFALFAYTIWTQKELWHSIRDRGLLALRVGFLVFFTFISMFIIATPATFLPVGFVNNIPVFPAFDLTRYYQYPLFLLLYYLVAGIIVSLAIYYFAMKSTFGNVLRSMRPAQTLFFGAVVAAGIVTGWRIDFSLDLVTHIFQTPYWVNLAFAGVAIIAALVAWQVSTMWNDLSDARYDERRPDRLIVTGAMPSRYIAQLSIVLAIVAVLLSFLLSVFHAMIMAAILGLAYLYSFEPVRFKSKLLSPLIIGVGTSMAFIYGYITPYSVVEPYTEGHIYYPFLTGVVSIPTLTLLGVELAGLMFLGLVVGSMVTDIKGFGEDKRAGVRTVYTIMGREKGARIVSILISLVALTPLVLFQSPQDLIVFPVLGAAAGTLFYFRMDSRPVLIIALIGLVYAAFRYLMIL
ncbi:MAG: UbiA family prenyltransferase [Methanomassiliicoccales archaeon]|jgi:4-hydroxybenzoate polyprenyltransferase